MDDFQGPEQQEKEKESVPMRTRSDYPRCDNNHEEEYSAEVAPTRSDRHEEEYSAEVAPTRSDRYELEDDVDEENDGTVGRTAGYVGVGLGVASLFMWSIVLGPIAAVTGYYAYSQGSKTWGAWGMGLGILATISYFVLIPFAR
ncbi:DUF5353 domain-containing protein [Paenibacillus sp. KQZ6P-2]|uniref:DUF5353 domain-containing protein n=1 Tax=Paenibacillus mangrovi TaxID=2931978 RepID=A0A9X2B1C7_9BACL|nr:DUF5353 domain-containing protein [Paenibacillus mangrovi]MCJ8011399.1 DUF5353 domain-containing protein [Paenibacillus mangrovi]